MGKQDARIHTGRDDCDGSAGCCCGDALCEARWWLKEAAEALEDGFPKTAAHCIERAQGFLAQAKARHQSLDGLHPLETAKVVAR